MHPVVCVDVPGVVPVVSCVISSVALGWNAAVRLERPVVVVVAETGAEVVTEKWTACCCELQRFSLLFVIWSALRP